MKKALYISMVLFIAAGCNRTVSNYTYSSKNEMYVAPATIQFQNESENAEHYMWDFGDGDTSHQANPSHRYLTSGNYLITLTAFKGKREKKIDQRILITPPEDCLVLLQTPQGEMLIKLLDETPLHRDNFLKLAEEGFYDDLLFHRVIEGFMVQGGDPDSKDAGEGQSLGSGSPGYQVPAEFHTGHFHYKGALAAARTSDAVNPEKKSSGSQFYIVHGKPVTTDMLDLMEARKGIEYTPEQKEIYTQQGGTPFLDNEYTVFGQVIQGVSVIDSIASVETGRGDRPVENVHMNLKVIK